MLNTPNFYNINFDREVVVQGRNTTFLSITRNENILMPNQKLVVVLYPQTGTWEHHATVSVTALGLPGVPAKTWDFEFSPAGDDPNGGSLWTDPKFDRMSNGLEVLNWYDVSSSLVSNVYPSSGVPLQVTNYKPGYGFTLVSDVEFIPNSTFTIELGKWVSSDGDNWKINGGDANSQLSVLNNQAFTSYWAPLDTTYPNPFDGTTFSNYGEDTGFFSRKSAVWFSVYYDDKNIINNGVSIRVDYDGISDSHLKLNFLIIALDNNDTVTEDLIRDPSTSVASITGIPYGWKSGSPREPLRDYQEVHFFGYVEDYVKSKRNTQSFLYDIENPVYEDRSSYSLLKTNPRISGNVKLTSDSSGNIWLNSFDANDELSNSTYKKYQISSNSTYQKDLYNFFKNGTTPANIVFDTYQVDSQYLNIKRTFDLQYDNFYNYGVEQLRSKFYDENFTFLAPIWLRKDVPDFFIIFRIDEPLNIDSYLYTGNGQKFNDFFKESRIIKTFDMRSTSKLGSYLRKIINDTRYQERPLQVSWEKDIATYWNGISYQDGSLTQKGEFLYDYYNIDRPIKEFEQYITDGFKRNGIISSNLINLEFLFDDDEADLYSINRYFGIYVKENQLAQFQIVPDVLGNIYNQSPEPIPGVDGEPYSTRSFVQTNPDGIQLPINYYHNTSFTNNTTNIPAYQGDVIGKIPLPSMVDDPLRFFYVKDRNDTFKRINKITEVDYGVFGTTDYIRATQIQLFDNQEDISSYAGVTNITTQADAVLLDSGNAQLVIEFFDQNGTGVLDEEEEIVLTADNYNSYDNDDTYYIQVTENVFSTYTKLSYFKNDYLSTLTSSFTQPDTSTIITINVTDSSQFIIGENIYIISGGYYQVYDILPGTQINIKNLGISGNAAVGATIFNSALIGKQIDGEVIYYDDPSVNYANVDNELTIYLTPYFAYSLGDAWTVDIQRPSVTKNVINGVNQIDATIRQEFNQHRWRLIANSTGLQKGDAWNYPVQDPNGIDYINHFSPKGTASEVAQAFALCLNNFENIPVVAFASGPKVYMISKLLYEEGNTINFKRILTPNSYYANLGFYEKGVCDRGENLSQLNYAPLSTINLNTKFVEFVDRPTDRGFYLKIIKTASGAIVSGNLDCDPTSYSTLTSTGTFFWANFVGNTFEYSGLPISIDLTQISLNTTIEVAYHLTSTNTINQKFIGGVRRKRNRAKVSFSDGTKYYVDRRTVRLCNLLQGSSYITLNTDSLYIGASVKGVGIPDGTFIIDVNATSIRLNNAVTVTMSNVSLNIGEITALNDTKINNQWFQCLKGLYSEIKGWNVQDKILYSLPYLEEPVYDRNENISGFTNLDNSLIIQIDNNTQEFYTSSDNKIVAWDIFRPSLGIFSLYPIKEFDFDFILSDYSYTPTIEAFPYFFNQVLNSGDELELDINENYKFTLNSSTDNFNIVVSVYNQENGQWYEIDTLSFNGSMVDSSKDIEVLFNTYYPLYKYVESEYPYLSVNGTYNYYVSPTSNYQFRGAGKRNFQRQYLRTTDPNTNEEIVFYPDGFKIKFLPNSNSSTLTVVNYNYDQDLDLKHFNGFAGLQDISSLDAANKIQDLKNSGDYIGAFTYQLLYSEYDRLRENFNKDWAVNSIVVPYINKWVQEGTDARDNYYRLNNSMAFGINNMSPNDQINFVETSVLTNEFPYLDSLPKDYYAESLESSRSYMFEKLDTVVLNGLTWYDLLSSYDNNDWFTKYFSVGYPTEETYQGVKITKAREERFTFFNYVNGVNKVETLFRGIKIQATVLDDIGPTPVEISQSTALDGYKFSAIARFVKPGINYDAETPVEIEVIKNDAQQSIVMIFTVYVNDYRTQSGHMNYLLQYAMQDILKNENQSQLPFLANTQVSLGIEQFLPYDGTFNISSPEANEVFRPRQGFLGGGYLELGNKRLGANIDFYNLSQDIFTGQLNVPFKQINSTYSFNLQNELSITNNRYTYLSGDFLRNESVLNIFANSLTQNGFYTGFSVGSKNPLGYVSIRYFFDNQAGIESITPSSLGFATTLNSQRTHVQNYTPLSSGLEFNPGSTSTTSSIDSSDEKETYAIGGGTSGFVSIQNYLTMGNIQSLVNSGSPAIQYFKVVNNEKIPASDFYIRFVSPDSIIKKGILHYAEDTDKPQEYINSSLIGYNLVNTNTQEYMLRHRGFYEPKSRDIISFWVRESDDFSYHYEKDFLLSNTHINTSYSLSGLLRNYGINKVATGGEVLKISRDSAYKSLYPLVNEVAVTSITSFALNSSWDADFYRNYTTIKDYTSVNGIAEMQETKSFLASKAMNVPKSFTFDTFTNTEVTYSLLSPASSIGVNNLITNTASANQQLPNSNKSVLTINIDLGARLLRQLLEDINSGNYVNEFDKLPLYSPGVPALNNLSQVEIDALKTNYFNKNIINLYEISEINLWVLNKEGIQLVSIELSAADKQSAGYKIDKDCTVTKVTDFVYKITKTLDTKVPSGFSVSSTVNRI